MIFAGFHKKSELPRFYAAAEIFVFPTLGDPYGLVVDEAMACALRIISTNAAREIRDRVQDVVNGYIVPPADGKIPSERMEKLTRDKGLRKKWVGFQLRKLPAIHPSVGMKTLKVRWIKFSLCPAVEMPTNFDIL